MIVLVAVADGGVAAGRVAAGRVADVGFRPGGGTAEL